ncbi:hypothetical protein KAS08_00025 [Candidatus Pacearchaeota archaeon]|nr:hypothetical protein [Candidatus Pacearchaeota archaeon]
MGCNCNNCDYGKEKIKESKIKAYFCPNCKSVNVKYVFELKNAFGVIPKMRCLDCKTEMASFPIVTTNEGEMKNSIDNKPVKKVKGVVKPKAVIKNGENKK